MRIPIFSRSTRPVSLATSLLLSLLLGACGGGSGGSETAAAVVTVGTGTTPVTTPTDPVTPTVPATPTTPTTPATPTGPALSAPAAVFVNLDLGNLFNYAAPTLPAYYGGGVANNDNTPANNTANNAVATLGRVLFYDKRLSVNNTVACASCHQQTQGFADSSRFSTGFAGGLTTAHAMRLGNVRYYAPGTMFWDKRAASVEDQATQPIQHPVEMGFDASNGGLAALLTKMQSLPYYPELFTFAFGDGTLSEQRIQRALAQFQRSMVAVSSRWDDGYAQTFNPAANDNGLNTPIAGFTAQENRGRQLFMGNANQGGLNCAACHAPPTFALTANSRSNGLDAGETTIFKSPSLKNVGMSAAFMHDGRFSSLEQVVEHYNSGVKDGPALDNRLRGGNGAPRVLNLPESDKAALVAFLRTLNDTSLPNDPKFSSPFRQ
ncbi:MAG: hypothetical protein KF740_12415 [Ramlibacter sp.]|nr:hypothetical protein [Ramlibacter sp.]